MKSPHVAAVSRDKDDNSQRRDCLVEDAVMFEQVSWKSFPHIREFYREIIDFETLSERNSRKNVR